MVRQTHTDNMLRHRQTQRKRPRNAPPHHERPHGPPRRSHRPQRPQQHKKKPPSLHIRPKHAKPETTRRMHIKIQRSTLAEKQQKIPSRHQTRWKDIRPRILQRRNQSRKSIRQNSKKTIRRIRIPQLPPVTPAPRRQNVISTGGPKGRPIVISTGAMRSIAQRRNLLKKHRRRRFHSFAFCFIIFDLHRQPSPKSKRSGDPEGSLPAAGGPLEGDPIQYTIENLQSTITTQGHWIFYC